MISIHHVNPVKYVQERENNFISNNTNKRITQPMEYNSIYLSEGSSGGYVICVEYDLHILNYYGGYFDGQFGPELESAVQNFQLANGLSPDGTVGPQTWNLLCQKIRYIQAVIDSWGIGPIATDGEGGAQTLNAVKEFQKMWGLKQDSYVGPNTRRYMNVNTN